MEKKYYSEASEAVHESAQGLFKVGAITRDRMKEFDEMCLAQKPKEAHKTGSPAETSQYSHITACG